MAAGAAWRVVLPVRLPYQFPPPLLLALSGGKAEKSERRGFAIARAVVRRALTSDQRRRSWSERSFPGKN